MNNDLKRQIADEIAEFTKRPQLREDELTTSQYAKIQDIPYKQAYDTLNQAEEDGLLERRRILHNGHWCWAYSRTENT